MPITPVNFKFRMNRNVWQIISFVFWLCKIVGWFVMFCMSMLVYRAVRDISKSNLFTPKEPEIYPTEDLTSSLLGPIRFCDDISEYDALIVVHSAVDHFKHREDYRETYGNLDFTLPYRLKVLFFLGVPIDTKLQTLVTTEYLQHEDIVQASFVDSYHNMSLKAVSVFRWLIEKCTDPRMIIKMDDDVLLDVDRFFEEFIPLHPYHNDFLLHCHFWESAEAERNGKWKLSRKQFPTDFFPDYCSGFFVIMHITAVEELYYAALETPLLWVDDVYVYGLVRKKTQDVQVLYLDNAAYSEEKYNECVLLYGYRCKYWATTLDVSPQSHLVPALLSLKANHQRQREESARGDWGSVTKDGATNSGLAHSSVQMTKRRCSPGTCRLRRRRQMERERVGSTRTLFKDSAVGGG